MHLLLTLIAQSAQMRAIQQLNIKISSKDVIVLIDGDIISLINGQASLFLP